jgi:hypothetical protein
MDSNLIYGIIFTLVGVLTLISLRSKNERFLMRLNNYRRRFGYQVGTIIHSILYIILPIVLGVYFFFFR